MKPNDKPDLKKPSFAPIQTDLLDRLSRTADRIEDRGTPFRKTPNRKDRPVVALAA